MKTLKPYQIPVFEEIKSKDKLGLFLQMRLGKTVITLKWIKHKGFKRVLVLCPKTVIPVWQEEILSERYTEDQAIPATGSTEEKYEKLNQWFKDTHIFITNYETISYCPDVLKLKWDCIVLDESPRIKNANANITRYLISMSDSIRGKILLSGLPNPEGSMDLEEQMRFLDSRFMGCKNFWTWREKYCIEQRYGGWEILPSAEKLLMKEVKSRCIFLSRKDAGIGEEKIYEKRYVELTSKQKKAYKEMMNKFKTTISDKVFSTKFVGPKYEFMTQIASGIIDENTLISDAKLLELIDLIKGELKGESIVVWFKHNAEIFWTEKYLRKSNIRFATFSGKKKEGEKEFSRGKIPVILAQPKCAKFGLNWSVSSTAIYFSNWWDLEVRSQSEDRIVHINKKEPLLYLDIVCKNTIDEDILQLLNTKDMNSKSFLFELSKRLKSRMMQWI